MSALLGSGFILGVFATQIMDISSLIGSRLGIIGFPRPSIIGRWATHLLHGKFFHEDIRHAPKTRYEVASGFLAHYFIGGTIGVLYQLIADYWSAPAGSFLFPVVFGLSTCIFPWFILFPSCGFGAFGLKGPPEMKPLRTSIYTHFFYGVAIYLLGNFI